MGLFVVLEYDEKVGKKVNIGGDLSGCQQQEEDMLVKTRNKRDR